MLYKRKRHQFSFFPASGVGRVWRVAHDGSGRFHWSREATQGNGEELDAAQQHGRRLARCCCEVRLS